MSNTERNPELPADYQPIPFDHPDHARVVSMLNTDQCPDCKEFGFEMGPRGGMSQNIFCSHCEMGFNVGPYVPKMRKRIMFVERIGKRRR